MKKRIVSLLQYVNGSVDDRTDDIIPEDRLYSLLCCWCSAWSLRSCPPMCWRTR